MLVAERLLQNTKLAVRRGQALDRHHLAAIGLNGEGQTRTRRMATDQHGACATHTVFTTDMGPGQVELVPKKIDQCQPRLNVLLVEPPVHLQRDRTFRHCNALQIRMPQRSAASRKVRNVNTSAKWRR